MKCLLREGLHVLVRLGLLVLVVQVLREGQSLKVVRLVPRLRLIQRCEWL